MLAGLKNFCTSWITVDFPQHVTHSTHNKEHNLGLNYFQKGLHISEVAVNDFGLLRSLLCSLSADTGRIKNRGYQKGIYAWKYLYFIHTGFDTHRSQSCLQFHSHQCYWCHWPHGNLWSGKTSKQTPGPLWRLLLHPRYIGFTFKMHHIFIWKTPRLHDSMDGQKHGHLDTITQFPAFAPWLVLINWLSVTLPPCCWSFVFHSPPLFSFLCCTLCNH